MVMVVGSFALAIFTLWLDSRYSFEVQTGLGLIYKSSIDGGRDLLSTIAGSMMTVTGVVFSITIVTLSLTSNQYGPRLLRNFLRDRGNQFVLGTFLGTFTYCLVILRTLQDSSDNATAPEISISVGAILALASLGVLIYFIHHVSQSIQASSILSGVGRELAGAVDTVFPERIGSGQRENGAAPEDAVPDPRTAQGEVLSDVAGYIRAIDPDKLLDSARTHDAVILLDVRPGAFVNEHGRLARTWCRAEAREPLAEAIRGAFIVGQSRTPFQDIQFLVSQLVQAALLALSPGVNNSIVAMEAIDWLGASLARVAERDQVSALRHDSEGKLRVIAEPATFASLMDQALDPIRVSARGNTMVALHLLSTMERLRRHAYRPEDRHVVLEHARLIHEIGVDGAIHDHERKLIREAYDRMRAVEAAGD